MRDYHGDDAAYRHISPNDFGKCEHVLKIPDNDTAYEIGVVRAEDGYMLVFDHWGPGRVLVDKIGKHGEKIIQAYTKTITLNKLAKKGFKLIKEELTSDNKLKLTLKGGIDI